MKGIKTKFNIMDFLIVLALVLVIVSSAFQDVAVKRFERENNAVNTVISLELSGVDEADFAMIYPNDAIYWEQGGEDVMLGRVVLSYTLPEKSEESEESDNAEIPTVYMIDVESVCLVNRDGLFIKDNAFIAPGMDFCADNAVVDFNCTVVSVEISH